MNLRYRAILFDFDGTLTPSLPLWVKAFQIALRQHAVEMADHEIIARFFYRDWHHSADELKLPREELVANVHGGLRVAFREAVLFPAIVDLLQTCRRHGMRTALVTSAPRFVLDESLPRLGIDAAFDHIVTADDVQHFKPHPEPIVKTLAALACRAQDAIMVGDSSADVLSGKAAGTATALYMPDDHRPYYPFEALRATNPDHIFLDHSELHDIFGFDRGRVAS